MSIRELANASIVVPPEGGKSFWLLAHLVDIKAMGDRTRGFRLAI